MRGLPRHGVAVALALAAAALIATASPYAVRVATVAGAYALLVIGYQLIFGQAGALSLAQGAFFGLGAYATGILSTRLGWEFTATFPAAILLPLAVAAIVAAPVLRLQSHYFALATLGLAQVASLVAVNWTELTGGANGIAGVPAVTVLGETMPRGVPMLAFVWGWVALGAVLAWRLLHGLKGLAFRLLREDEIAAASIGLDAGRLRFDAFLASAAFAGAAGALHAHTLRVVSPESIGFGIMVACLSMAVVGGRGRIAGAIVGALLLVALPEAFGILDRWRGFAYGAALLAAIVLMPWGLVGAAERLLARLLPADPAPATEPVAPAIRPRPAALQVSDATKHFGGVRALDRVSLAVRPGEIVGLIGPNGSGKTTLLNLVSGLAPAETGSVRLGGADLARLAPFAVARHGVGRSFQTLRLAEDLTALDAVAVACRVPPRAGAAALRRARGEAMHWLGVMGAGETAPRPCGVLAHGTRRRVELARALATRPAILLLDEPAAGLAAEEQEELAQRLRRLAGEGLGLLVVEHNFGFLADLADRIVCLERGRVIAAGTPAEIRRDARVLEAYLGRPERAA
jgi:branched-chain amino acid transport system permease protein